MQVHGKLSHQRGVALFFGLILLLILTVLGVASFQNSYVQERSAGNARLQAVAFEAAAAGAANAINFFDANRDLGPDQLCGDLDHTGWDDPTAWVDMGGMGDASLKQRMYCLADAYPCTADDVSCGERPPRSQLFVLSRGEVAVGGNVVAERDVEVRLDLGHEWATGDGCGAICFPTCEPGSIEFGNSNAFQVDGGRGYAVTGGCQDMVDAIDDGIRDNRIGNYDGGIGETQVGSPWDDPDSVEAFRAHIEAMAMAAQDAGTCMTFCYQGGDVVQTGSAEFGTVADPQVTYIHGSAEMGGNVSGAGILFANGPLAWHGTPNFTGLLVTAGGSFTILGGGSGGDFGGSVVILNAPGDGAEFGETSFDNTGGGTGLYTFECDSLWAAHELLDDSGQALWNPECDTGPQNPFEAGPTELIIASWRENIGWREEFFGSGN